MAETVTIEQLKNVLDNYNQAVLAGEIDKALSFRDQQTNQEIVSEMATPEGKAGMLQMMQSMTPLSYTCEHLDQNTQKAELYCTALFKNPETPEQTVTQELAIGFSNEGGTWKLGSITFMPDPDKIRRSPDQNFEPESGYDSAREVSAGGRIVKVSFENEYTLVVIRMMDEEDLIFLPKKENLAGIGLDVAQMIPWKVLSVNGHPHQSSTFKIWAIKGEIVEPVLG